MTQTSALNSYVTIRYYDSIDSNIVNRRQKGVIPTGVYSGGYLTRVNDSSVSVSPLVCEIQDKDGNHDQIRIETTDNIVVTGVSSTDCYIVVRWVYTGVVDTDYPYIEATSSPDDYELVLGKASYVGATMQTTFNYGSSTATKRSTPRIMDLFCKVEAEQTPSMYVRIREGVVQIGNNKVIIYDQLSSVFTAPVSGSKTGAVYITDAGAIAVSSDFTNTGQTVLAEIALTVGQTTITADDITDVRSFLAPLAIPDNVTLQRDITSGKLEIKAIESISFGSKVYDSGWFAVTKNTSYTKTHGLGTTKVLFQLYFSTSSGGTNPAIVTWFYDHSHGDFSWAIGGQVTTITTTTCIIKTGTDYSGYIQGTTGDWYPYYISGYYRLLAFAIS